MAIIYFLLAIILYFGIGMALAVVIGKDQEFWIIGWPAVIVAVILLAMGAFVYGFAKFVISEFKR